MFTGRVSVLFVRRRCLIEVVHVLHAPRLRAVAVEGEGLPERAWRMKLGIMRPSSGRILGP
jgi:hypothetical protein